MISMADNVAGHVLCITPQLSRLQEPRRNDCIHCSDIGGGMGIATILQGEFKLLLLPSRGLIEGEIHWWIHIALHAPSCDLTGVELEDLWKAKLVWIIIIQLHDEAHDYEGKVGILFKWLAINFFYSKPGWAMWSPFKLSLKLWAKVIFIFYFLVNDPKRIVSKKTASARKCSL